MKPSLMSLLVLLLLIGCSTPAAVKIIDEVKLLNTENSIVDTAISLSDRLGNNGQFQSSIRNKVDLVGDQVFIIMDELFDLEEMSERPELPDYNYDIFISAQRRKDLKVYKINFMIDSQFEFLKMIKIESSERERQEYDGYYRLNENIRASLKKIINFERSRAAS